MMCIQHRPHEINDIHMMCISTSTTRDRRHCYTWGVSKHRPYGIDHTVKHDLYQNIDHTPEISSLVHHLVMSPMTQSTDLIVQWVSTRLWLHSRLKLFCCGLLITCWEVSSESLNQSAHTCRPHGRQVSDAVVFIVVQTTMIAFLYVNMD